MSINAIKNNITELEQRYHRKPGSVILLAVSKTRSIEAIKQALAAGQHYFGENYVQEALPKIKALANQYIEWHFVGLIQANKTKAIAENFSWVHSVASNKIAQRLNNQRPLHLPPLNICLQINVSNEPTKSGITFKELPDLAKTVNKLPRLKFRGLMAIPEATTDFQKQRNNFHKLKMAFNELKKQGFNIDTLSMGMSGDYEAAIAEGATIIRLGTAIFGARNYNSANLC